MGYRGTLQKVSAALMTPVVILPMAAIFMAVGLQLKLGVASAAGKAILIQYLPLLFAVSVAIGFTRQDGMAAFSAVVGYTVMTSVMASIDSTIDMGVLGGIIVGAFTAFLFNRYHTIKLPEYLGLFSGKRFIPIATALTAFLLGVFFGEIWPPIQDGIVAVGQWIIGAGAKGVFVYGTLNRLLIPTGLHHIINQLVEYQMGSFTDPVTGKIVFGEQIRFYAGDPTAGKFLAGFFVLMNFSIPAIALAITHEARPENRKRVAGIMVTALLTSIITGVTEPVEFAFMFVAPLLFVVHALLTGTALFVTYILGVRHYGHALPMFFINLGLASRPWLIIPVGLVYFGVYYVAFRSLIRWFNIPTLGREGLLAEEEPKMAAFDRADKVAQALGGLANILSVESCITRLRLVLKDQTLVRDEELRHLGASGVARLGGGLVQVVLGTQSEAIRDEIRQLMAREAGEDFALVAPMTGRIVPLADVPDPVFAQRLAGDGVAIDPSDAVLVAPCKGKITHIFPGGHAMAVTTDGGLEVLLHIGLDTVGLEGKGFTTLVKEGQTVQAGQQLARFEIDEIKAAGKSLISPILIANADRLHRLEHAEGDVRAGRDIVLKLWLQ